MIKSGVLWGVIFLMRRLPGAEGRDREVSQGVLFYEIELVERKRSDSVLRCFRSLRR